MEPIIKILADLPLTGWDRGFILDLRKRFADNPNYPLSAKQRLQVNRIADAHQVNLQAIVNAIKPVSHPIVKECPQINIEGLRLFQNTGVSFLINTPKCILADDMGLGKTLQTIKSIEQHKQFPVLICCPASLKLNWHREIQKWSAMDCDVDEFNSQITITNYEKLKKVISHKFKTVIFDEGHYLKNSKSQRTKNAVKLSGRAGNVVILTGTPILNRPSELISLLKIIGQFDNIFGNWERFVYRYCAAKKTPFGLDYTGASNLQELHQKLKPVMLRRLKSEVLSELPAKQRIIVPVELDNKPEYIRAKDDFKLWLQENGYTDKQIKKINYAKMLVQMEKLKQLAATGKMQSAIEWVENFIESGEKLIVFAHHQEVINHLCEHFSCQAITGQTKISDRQRLVDDFQNNQNTKIIILNIKAGGTGLTLTAASNVLFLEQAWTPGEMEQAEDRAHRIGQSESVNCWYMLGVDSIDEVMYNVIQEKREIFAQAIDGADIDVCGKMMELMRD